ncbi:hypothetical protein PRIPAC_74560 [Pristionchus pacificus]|uniref:Helicase n=1 Tax=Pristionchus pacificus TaxID=54126 RepID=A0A2A6CRH3_PRIPA|nr:hypothetical protein PRIPAC_74560 [Pristionchus pacificus]|eukprot:PDM80696.1 helicase [Pristionchus pacificus]
MPQLSGESSDATEEKREVVWTIQSDNSGAVNLGMRGLARRATKFAEGTLVKCKIAYGECAFFQQKKRVEKTQYLVLDEADRMLVMGFAEEVMEIMEKGGIAGKEDLVENGEFVQEEIPKEITD